MRSIPEPPPDVTPDRRALTRRAADVCRADPSIYAAVVRYADHLRAARRTSSEPPAACTSMPFRSATAGNCREPAPRGANYGKLGTAEEEVL